MADRWKIQSLRDRLEEIHPTLDRVYLNDDTDPQIEITFSDGGHPMIATSFIYGSETRNILEELEELLEEEPKDDTFDTYGCQNIPEGK